MHILAFLDCLTFNIVVFLCIVGNSSYDFAYDYFILISVVSPKIQGDRSLFIYVLDELYMLSSDFSYLLLDQFCTYQFSWLKC